MKKHTRLSFLEAGYFKLLVAAWMILTMQIGWAMRKEDLCRLPNAEILRERLNEAGYGAMVDQTSIIASLANEERYPHEVAVVVKQAINAYNNPYERIPPMRENDVIRQLLRIILPDFPGVIEKLKRQHIIR